MWGVSNLVRGYQLNTLALGLPCSNGLAIHPLIAALCSFACPSLRFQADSMQLLPRRVADMHPMEATGLGRVAVSRFHGQAQEVEEKHHVTSKAWF